MPYSTPIIVADINLTWLAENWGPIAGAVIVVLGLLVVGFRDVGRFSLKRAWAISGVCFAESIRKRVLLIAPLAIVGVVIIAQLQRAIDVEDAVRQTIRSCIFAIAIVVTLTSIILACTNLPKEIESKVIFTVVTKPATRLELILGKIIGFSRVSLCIVLILGIFTWAYVRLRTSAKNSDITAELKGGMINKTERERLEHYQEAGLLSGYSLLPANELQMFGRRPDTSSKMRVIAGDGGQDFIVRFPFDKNILFGERGAVTGMEEWRKRGAGAAGLVIRVAMKSRRTGSATDQPEIARMGPEFGPHAQENVKPPMISLQILDQNRNSFNGSANIVGASSVPELQAYISDYVQSFLVPRGGSAESVRLSEPQPPDNVQYAYAWIPLFNLQLNDFFRQEAFYVRVAGISQNVDFLVGEHPIQAFVPTMKDAHLQFDPNTAVELPEAPGGTRFRGGIGTEGGQQLLGTNDPTGSVAVYTFANAPKVSFDGKVPFQLTATVSRSGVSVNEGREDPTTLDVAVIDLNSSGGNVVHADSFQVESHEPAFFTVPASAITGAGYQIWIQCRSPGHSLGLFPSSLQLEMGRESFEWNLLKSLTIVWMMSILVVTLSVLCSTFLSWPIAIVLATLLLLGHWGVNQLSDVTTPGLGRQVATDFGIGASDAALNTVVSSSVDALSHLLNYIAQGLPDTERFDSIEDISRGNSIPWARMTDAMKVLLGFGLPSLALAYVIMKGKEVAP